jgi:hypothetical protein
MNACRQTVHHSHRVSVSSLLSASGSTLASGSRESACLPSRYWRRNTGLRGAQSSAPYGAWMTWLRSSPTGGRSGASGPRGQDDRAPRRGSTTGQGSWMYVRRRRDGARHGHRSRHAKRRISAALAVWPRRSGARYLTVQPRRRHGQPRAARTHRRDDGPHGRPQVRGGHVRSRVSARDDRERVA